MRRLATLWEALADPATLARLLAITTAGIAAAVVATRFGTQLTAGAQSSALVERLYILLELHAPLQSWWVAVLVGATVLSLAAVMNDAPGALALQIGAGIRREANATVDLHPRAGRRAADAMGENVRITQTLDHTTAWVAPTFTRAGTLLVFLGAAVLIAAGSWARHASLAGEMLLSLGEVVDRVIVPGQLGATQTRGLDFGLEAVQVESGGGRGTVQVLGGRDDGTEVEVTPAGRVVVNGLMLQGRATRRRAGGEQFRLVVEDRQAESREERTVFEREAIEVGGATYRVVGFARDLRGLGEAVRIERDSTERGSDAFWVLRAYPGFDRRNRVDPVSFELVGVERSYQLIVSASRYPGVVVGAGGAAALLVGVLVCLAGARKTRVVRVGPHGAVGRPGEDGAVKAGLRAAVGSPS